jgi:hypothetical protein
MADMSQLRKPPRKGEPPKPTETAMNLVKPPVGNNVPLQLKISPELRRDFHVYAASHDLDANELFEQVWHYYKERRG